MLVSSWWRYAAAAALALLPSSALEAQDSDPWVSYHIMHADHYEDGERVCVVGPMIRLRYDRRASDWLEQTSDRMRQERAEFGDGLERMFGWRVVVLTDEIGLDDQAPRERAQMATGRLEHRLELCRVGPYHRRIQLDASMRLVVDAPGALGRNESASGQGGRGTASSTKDDSGGLTQAEVQYRVMQAEQLEAEGDRYVAMGAMGYGSALERYRQAYMIYPDPRIAQKISSIETMFAAGQAATESLDRAFENAGNTLEAAGIQSFIGTMTAIEFGMGGASGDPPAMGFSVGASIHWILSLDLFLGYFRSPVFESAVSNQYDRPTDYTIRFTEQGIGMGGSIGLSYPFGRFVPYAMWGTGLYGMYGSRTDAPSSNVTFEADDEPLNTFRQLSAGVNYRFSPGFGMGLRYSSTTASSSTGGSIDDVIVPGSSSLDYYAESPEDVTYGALSVQFFFNML